MAALLSPIRLIALLATAACLGACDSSKNADRSDTFPATSTGALEISYPLNDTLFPPDIAAPTFVWKDLSSSAQRWRVWVSLAGGNTLKTFDSETSSWQPPEAFWSEVKKLSVDQDAHVAVAGLDADGNRVSSATVNLRTSMDPVGDSIFYREVPLPFISAVQDPARIRWRFGSVDSVTRPPVVLENLPVCGNCHSFSGDGKTLGLDVDYGNDKGGYAMLPVSENMVLNDEKIITWSDYKKDDGEATFGLLSQVSPDGRYVISTVKDRAVFVATPGIEFSQLFFPIKGILVVYDSVTGEYQPLPGADDPDYVQSNPTWSPDGKSVVFARTKAYRKEILEQSDQLLLSEKDFPEFIEDKQPYKFNLYRVPFNDGKGGVAKPIEGASHNDRSNFFAKFSPDGKWIVFTQAENYMLLMPDSELYIIPAEGGEARRLRANTTRMNSWHSFSSNGRWLVFSSKQNTPYTQLFLTHINDQGESTPAVLLDRFTDNDRAANIPEFVPLPANSIAQIKEQFLDAYSFLRAGMANERTGNYPAAVKAYNRGLETEPENVELLNALGFALFQKGDSEKAVSALDKALRADPKHYKAHNNMALASIDLGELEIAEAHYRESLAIEPQPAIYNDLGFVLERQGLSFEAVDMYRKALELNPESATAHYNLATSLTRSGEFQQAEPHFRAVVRTQPTTQALTGLGIVQKQLGNKAGAKVNFGKAIEADPRNAAAYDQLAAVLIEENQLADAASLYQQLIGHAPSAAAHQELAEVLEVMGQSDQANAHRSKAQKLKQTSKP